MAYKIQKAFKKDASICADFIEEARIYQNEQGFVQWTKDYPNLDSVIDDIHKGKGYML